VRLHEYRAIKLGAGLALLVVVTSVIAHAFPALVGAEYSYVVQSGSMEPAIGTGSVVFVAERPAEKIGEGDVITFADSQTGPTTTHRVIEKHQGNLAFGSEQKVTPTRTLIPNRYIGTRSWGL